MQIAVDYDDHVSILAHVHHVARHLEPIFRCDFPALLGRHTPSGLARVADAAGRRQLHIRGFAGDMLPVIVDACTLAIEDGASRVGEWIEVGYSDGGVDWAWRDTEVHTDEALHLFRLLSRIAELIDLLERIDDLIAAQRDIGDLQR